MKNKFKRTAKVTHNIHGYGDRVHFHPDFELSGTDYVTLEKDNDKIVVTKITHDDVK